MEEVQTPKKEPGDIYLEAAVLAQSTDPAEIAEAYRLFASIPGYLDARQRAEALKPQHDKFVDEEKANKLKALQNANRKKSRIKKLIIFAVILAVLAAGAVLLITKIHNDYDRAVALIEQGEYREASSLLKFQFGYSDSEELVEQLQFKLDAYDSIKQELLSGEDISSQRMTELHDALLLMQDFSEARELLTRFSRRLDSYTRAPATGSYTMYHCGYDAEGAMTTLTASSHTASGELKVTYTKYITGTVEDSQIVHEYDYGSKKLSDNTIIKEVWFYDNGHETEMETVYHDEPSLHIFYRWYDMEGKLLYGVTEDSSIPKTTSKKTVLVECRTLDENGRLVRSWQLDVSKKGKISTDKEKEIVYTYDENGNLSLETHYKTTEKKGKVDHKVSYSYDAQNRIISIVDDDATTVYSYNELGELSETVLTKNKKDTKTTYRYGYFFNRDGLE